jgi:hypothetical protein
MTSNSFTEALRPLAAKLGLSVVEHEVMRVAATVGGTDASKSADLARREILAWAQKRSGAQLPPEAWAMQGFEHMSGGRNCAGLRFKAGETDIWAIRADDPDKTIPGRIWTHEIVIGLIGDQKPRFSVRQLVSTSEQDLLVEPHAPGFIQQVVKTCGLMKPSYALDSNPWLIKTPEDADDLADVLVAHERRDPVFVLTVPEDATDPSVPLLDAVALNKAMLGLARVVVLPARFTWALTDRFGRVRSAFGGAVRAYLPGFSDDSNPYDHRLILADHLASPEGRARVGRWLRSSAASQSLKTDRLGRDVLAFAAIRNVTLRATQEQLSSGGGDKGQQLALAAARIQALENELESERKNQSGFAEEADRERERAEAAEEQLRAASYRVQQLQGLLKSGGVSVDADLTRPANWADFAEWCNRTFPGRLTLAAAARRGLRKPVFSDVALAARCIVWLATTYRDGRQNGADGDFRDYCLEDGIKNTPCGGDEFDFDWQGRRYSADWHIKSGGNTRAPERALRIYYCWDDQSGQVIVADMPAHRPSAVS